jgi:hypothetical protein
MKDSPQERVRPIFQHVSCNANDSYGYIGCIRWATVLISNDTDFVSALAKRQHRSHKVFAIRRVNPCRAKDNVLISGCSHSLFAG